MVRFSGQQFADFLLGDSHSIHVDIVVAFAAIGIECHDALAGHAGAQLSEMVIGIGAVKARVRQLVCHPKDGELTAVAIAHLLQSKRAIGEACGIGRDSAAVRAQVKEASFRACTKIDAKITLVVH